MPLKKFKAKLTPEVTEISVALKKRLLSTTFAGEIASALKGRGIEFEDYRKYTPFDDASRIDWRASQRSQRLLVRQYKIEINYNIFFLMDTSESMLYSSTGKLKCEYAAEIVANLFFGLLQAGNSVGFGLFNEGVYRIAKPMLGKRQFYIFEKEIANPKNYGGRKDINWTLQQVLAILDKKTLVILVSDFIGDDTKWAAVMNILAHRHEALGIMIRDPRDVEIPYTSGQFVFQDPSSNQKLYVDSHNYSSLYNIAVEKEMNLVRTIFKQNHSRLFEITTDNDYFNPMMKFFSYGGGSWR